MLSIRDDRAFDLGQFERTADLAMSGGCPTADLSCQGSIGRRVPNSDKTRSADHGLNHLQKLTLPALFRTLPPVLDTSL